MIKAQIRRARTADHQTLAGGYRGHGPLSSATESMRSCIQGAGGCAPAQSCLARPQGHWAAASPLTTRWSRKHPQASWPRHLGTVSAAAPQAAQMSPTMNSGCARPIIVLPAHHLSLGPCFQLEPHQFQVLWVNAISPRVCPTLASLDRPWQLTCR